MAATDGRPHARHVLALRMRSAPMTQAANARKTTTKRRSAATPRSNSPDVAAARRATMASRNAMIATAQPKRRRRAPGTAETAGRTTEPSAKPNPQSQRSAVGALIRPHFGHFISCLRRPTAAHQRGRTPDTFTTLRDFELRVRADAYPAAVAPTCSTWSGCVSRTAILTSKGQS
jgi:hypothetical protein